MALVTHTFLREHRDDIVRAWEALAAAEPGATRLAGPALRDRLPDLLVELADWVERGGQATAERLRAGARLHAAQRLDNAFELPQLLRDYAILRGVILRGLLGEVAGEQATAGARARAELGAELARLGEGLDLAIASAVERFVARREHGVAGPSRSERARRAAEARCGQLVRLSPDAILLYRDGQVIFVNPASLQLFGATSERELVGKSPFQLVHPRDHALLRERILRLQAGDPGGQRIELTILRLDGTPRLAEAHATPIEDADGPALEAVVRDVTDQRRAGEALHESEERLRAHIDNSPLAVIEFDPQFTITRWSKGAERVFGWAASEILGRRIQEVRWVHEDDRESVERLSARLLRGETGRTLHVNRNYRKDGSVVHCEWYSSALHDAHGRLISILSQVLDVTDRTRAEEELRESEERFRTLAANMAQLAWMADGNGSAFWFNERWLEFTGLTFDEARGSGWLKAQHPDHLGLAAEKMARCLLTGEPLDDTCQMRGRDGAYRWFLCRAVPIRDARGRLVRWFGTCTDVTEVREAQEALRAADRRKTEFLAVLSHEIRNDLAPIANGLRLLERTLPGSAQYQRAREIIRREVEHVATLVDDLLDVSAIDTGKIALDRRRFDARDAARRVCENVSATFEERGVALKLDAGAEPLWVDADETRLAQIMGNLLGNALKFTPPPGAVTVTLGKAGGAVELRVRDTGAGIEPRLLDRIFEPFAQAERPRGIARGGMGIGLTLVKSFVTMHGGTVRALSEGPGRGTELVVTLPLATAPAAEQPKPVPVEVPSLEILLVDDNRDAAETLAQLLQLEGHRTRLAIDGASATAAFLELAPDVLVSDIGLPDESGYDLVRRIRGLPRGRRVFAVALTGYAQTDDVERARQAGFDAHLPKAAPLDRLDALLAEAAARRAGAEPPSPPRSAGTGDGSAPTSPSAA